MRGTEIANYFKSRVEAEAKVVKTIKAKSEEDKLMEELEREEHKHDFDRLTVEMQ
jgi:hypothetical protein